MEKDFQEFKIVLLGISVERVLSLRCCARVKKEKKNRKGGDYIKNKEFNKIGN
jgi:hypothetical protein